MNKNSNTNENGNCANRVLPPVKTLKSFIKLCDRISAVDRDEMKGIMTEEQYELVGIIRASVQNELSELKSLLP
jgi:hypothetical protein